MAEPEGYSRAELLDFAVNQIRDLDEAARSMIPGFGSFDAEEIDKLLSLEDWRDAEEAEDAAE